MRWLAGLMFGPILSAPVAYYTRQILHWTELNSAYTAGFFGGVVFVAVAFFFPTLGQPDKAKNAQ